VIIEPAVKLLPHVDRILAYGASVRVMQGCFKVSSLEHSCLQTLTCLHSHAFVSYAVSVHSLITLCMDHLDYWLRNKSSWSCVYSMQLIIHIVPRTADLQVFNALHDVKIPLAWKFVFPLVQVEVICLHHSHSVHGRKDDLLWVSGSLGTPPTFNSQVLTFALRTRECYLEMYTLAITMLLGVTI